MLNDIVEAATKINEIRHKRFTQRVDRQVSKLFSRINKADSNFKRVVLKRIDKLDIPEDEEDIKSFDHSVKISIDEVIDPDDAKKYFEESAAITLKLATDLGKEESGRALRSVPGLVIDEVIEEAAERQAEIVAVKINNLYQEKHTSVVIRDITKKVLSSEADGIGNKNELKKIILKTFDTTEKRAEQHAQTLAYTISNKARVEAFQESGIVKNMIWRTLQDERVCPICEPLHDKVVAFGEVIFKGGEERIDSRTNAEGEVQRVKWTPYADIGEPPAHVACRCLIEVNETIYD